MTIAAGFICADGIILAADTQYTVGSTKTNGQKIYDVIEDGDYRLILAGAGDVPYIRMTADKLVSNLLKKKLHSESDVIEVVGATLKWVHKEHIFPHPADQFGNKPMVQLLVAIRSSAGLKLLASNATAVFNVTDYQVLGSGVEIASYILDRLREHGYNLPTMEILATYVISVAKRYDNYCGGDTQLVTLHRDGRIERTTPTSTELWLSTFEDIVNTILIPSANLEEGDTYLPAAVDMLKDTIIKWRKFRREQIAKAEQADKAPSEQSPKSNLS
jgi:20S proteasome alpha/beta subunit